MEGDQVRPRIWQVCNGNVLQREGEAQERMNPLFAKGMGDDREVIDREGLLETRRSWRERGT